MNSIIYNGKTYKDGTLRDLDCYIGDSLVSDELPVDTLTAVVMDYSTQPRVLVADGLPVFSGDSMLIAKTSKVSLDAESQYGDIVRFYRGETQFGKFFLESTKRTGKYEYTLNCLSAIGLLLTSDHYGGIYNGEPAAEVMKDIIGGIISYTLSDELASVPIYGLLKKAKRRDNLRDLLFAIGGQIRKDTLGELNIIPMTTGEPYEIAADEFYTGGSVTGGNPATRIDVTEHSYINLPSDEIITLYEGESAAEEMVTPKGNTVKGVLVDFSDPMHDLSIQNAEILESGVNYAVISGSSSAVLTGKKYTHTERIVTRQKNNGGTPNVLTSKDCTLVNLMNSELVADRLMAYYGAAKNIETDIVVGNQKPGDAVIFDDPFGDVTTGFIVDMDLIVSTTLKAKTTIVSGFTPTASGNYYSNLSVISESGIFIVPPECKGKIRVVIIGGGDGGNCGFSGENGTRGSNSAGQGGKGGKGGKGGLPGKVFVSTISANAGQSFNVKIGKGGKGAVFGGIPGTGEPTIFGSVSSDDGTRPENGYIGILGKTVYATHGEDGVSGAPGGNGGEHIDYGNPYYDDNGKINGYDFPGHTGEEVCFNETCYPGGVGGKGLKNEYGYASGGGGGGASVGSDGEKGEDSDGISVGGKGGNGATPIKAENGQIAGSGGRGGHGGGGGGGGGLEEEGFGGWGGIGGVGGEAGDGASGVCLIYY